MKPNCLFSKQFWFGLATLTLVAGVMLSDAKKKGADSFRRVKNEPAGTSLEKPIRTESGEATTPACQKSGIEAAQGYRRLYDEMKEREVLLISKSGSTHEDGGDLWLRDRSHERFVAEDVTGAKFSPDGRKFAYATSNCEVFVETLAGERLAEIPRASEPFWGVESKTLNFVVIPSPEYPELQQQAVYDLNSGRVVEPEQ